MLTLLITFCRLLRIIIIPFFIFISITAPLGAQRILYPNTYLVQFTDKNFNKYSLTAPSLFLSDRALARREKQNITLNQNDLPVSQLYTDSLKKLGFEIVYCSKWLNAAAIIVNDTSQLKLIKGLSFVSPSLKSKNINDTTAYKNKWLVETQNHINEIVDPVYGPSYNQIAMLNGQFLHSLGYKGKGMIIAVLDGGFQDVKEYSSLNNLWFENRVILTRDFVDKSGLSFYSNIHGSEVLSIMAANSPGNLIGSAPEAKYILLRTENVSSEYPIEEFNWVVAAELADSIGADIIQSSLGYNRFDDRTLSYTYQQMDGKTAISSRGAKIAASKGIIVVISAGNEGSNNNWKYVTAPADADSILAVGAIDDNGNHAFFSSYGPTSDKRIKPDVVAKGLQTSFQSSANSFTTGNGTSFASPIISGLTACLWQAFPKLSNKNIIQIIKQYASLSNNPDTIKGYGLPDFKKSLYDLNPALYPYKNTLFTYPNPCETYFNIEFEAVKSDHSILSIIDLAGKTIAEINLNTDTHLFNSYQINALADKPRGIYILRLKSDSKYYEGTITKL